MFLEAWEVSLYSDAKDKIDVKLLSSSIDAEEYAFFTKYLDADTYNCFVTKKTLYGEIGHEVFEYRANMSITRGDFVHYRGKIYEANTSGICPAPNCDTKPSECYWTEANRFTDAYLQELWVLHLRRLLALRVHIASIPAMTYQTGALGVTSMIDDNTGNRGATRGEVSFLIDSLNQKVYNGVELMKNYIEQNKDNLQCFTWTTGCGADVSPLKNRNRGARKFYAKGYGWTN